MYKVKEWSSGPFTQSSVSTKLNILQILSSVKCLTYSAVHFRDLSRRFIPQFIWYTKLHLDAFVAVIHHHISTVLVSAHHYYCISISDSMFLSIDFVRVTNCFYDYDYDQHISSTVLVSTRVENIVKLLCE